MINEACEKGFFFLEKTSGDQRKKHIKPSEAFIEEFNQCHAFVYASAFETFGVIFVESMSMGKPIISLDCGSAREIISELSGIIVEKRNAQDMSSSMEELYNNYSKYDSYSIRKFCESNFSEKKLSLKMIGHYIDVLNNR